MTERTITLETSHDTLQLCTQTGRLLSFRSKAAPDQEFMATNKDDPVFVIQYLDEANHFRQIASTTISTLLCAGQRKRTTWMSMPSTFS